jgi:hypothetical protein
MLARTSWIQRLRKSDRRAESLNYSANGRRVQDFSKSAFAVSARNLSTRGLPHISRKLRPVKTNTDPKITPSPDIRPINSKKGGSTAPMRKKSDIITTGNRNHSDIRIADPSLMSHSDRNSSISSRFASVETLYARPHPCGKKELRHRRGIRKSRSR